MPLKSAEVVQPTLIDVDMAMLDDDRTQRAASVLSGMSAEDMEAAETLNSLHASKRSQMTLLCPQLNSLHSPRVPLTATVSATSQPSSDDNLISRHTT